ncbi:MAG: primosomal protein N' [Phycisphaerae bacterium]|nr:primosomal protein N' [Phycisphaerae bacterium]
MESLFDDERTRTARRAHGHVLVAVERGVDAYPDGLLYGIDESLATLADGERVIVPLGGGDTPTHGYVVRHATDAEIAALDPKRVKRVLARDEGVQPIPAELLSLARWISGYYCCPIGVTLTAILPAAVRKGVGSVTRTFVDVGEPPEDGVRLPAKQRELLAFVAALPPGERPIESRELLVKAAIATPGPLKALVSKGYLRAERRTEIEAKFERAGLADGATPTPTALQAKVIEAIGADIGKGFAQHLLFGVTGSGKTEVYIRLVDAALRAGKRALVLVPEIALTPQTAGRLVSRFPGRRVAILHSGLTGAQRNRMWAMVAKGDAEIVLGARSAVFAPIPDGALGLVIVDEEHDSSYKADQAPRYHGRDVAIRRAQLAGCPIVLGSATPSLESWANATSRGVSTLHRLPDRAPGLIVPTVRIVDFAEERRQYKDRRVHLIGPTLRAALEHTLRAGGQAVILLNRRGFANYVSCSAHDCDWVMRCDQCDAGMVCHRARLLASDGTIGSREYTRCHHCDAQLRLPRECPTCGRAVNVFGLGTQRVEDELTRLFPQLVMGDTLMRVDADSMHDAEDFRDALERFAQGSVRVLLGTQMIAKGLDFPNVRVVGVISADTALQLPDFRSGERTFQLVSQVTGRCGRGEHGGIAVIQTFQPNAPAIVLAAKHDFERFAERELADRAKFGLPPARRLTRLVVRDAGETECAQRARALAESLRALASRDGSSVVDIHGPAACPIARIAGRYRQQVEIRATSAADMSRFLTEARNAGYFAGLGGGGVQMGADLVIDVDPVAML